MQGAGFGEFFIHNAPYVPNCIRDSINSQLMRQDKTTAARREFQKVSRLIRLGFFAFTYNNQGMNPLNSKRHVCCLLTESWAGGCKCHSIYVAALMTWPAVGAEDESWPRQAALRRWADFDHALVFKRR